MSRKPISAGVGCLVIVLVLVVIGYLVPGEKTAPTPAAVPATPTDPAEARRADSVKAATKAAALAEIEKLKPHFIFEKDEIHPEQGWYTHRSQTTQNSYNRIYLDAPVNTSGFTYLRSHYYGDDWIFHTKVLARIGANTLESEDIPSYDSAVEHENSSGSVWETISFTKNRDGGILAAVAHASPGDTVIVRFEGKYAKTFQLSTRDRTAIAESFRLAELLRVTQP